MSIIFNSTARTLRAPLLSDFNFSINVHEQSVVISEATTFSTVSQDANVVRSIATLSEKRFSVAINQVAGSSLNGVRIEATNGLVSGNDVSRVTDGACAIFARHPWLTRRVDVAFLRQGGESTDTFTSFVTGSLAKHLLDSMTTLATGKSSVNQPLFTATNFAGQQYTRSTECWVPLDLSGIAMSADSLGRGCAVSPRHVILAQHVGGQGSSIHFVSVNNAVVVRTITNSVSVSGDLSVGLLDSDLPVSIKPLKVLPATFANYLPSVTTWPVPGFCIDGQKKVLSQEITKLVDAVLVRTPASSPFSGLTEPIVGGDSGNAALMVINNEPVLLGCFYTAAGNSASCPSICSNIAGVNAAMTTLGGGYQLTTVDLSGFNFYG